MTLFPSEGDVEVAVSAERPAVVLDKRRDQTGFVMLVKSDWTGLRRLFWTGLFCCRHRYARIESRLLAVLFHCQKCVDPGSGVVQSPSRPYWRTCFSLLFVSDNQYAKSDRFRIRPMEQLAGVVHRDIVQAQNRRANSVCLRFAMGLVFDSPSYAG